MDLRSFQTDPSKFQAAITVPTAHGPRRLGDVMAPFQRQRFSIVNPSLLAVTRHEPPPVPRIWDERTKGASKDSDWAVNVLWLLMFSRRQLRIQVGAYDAQQADELRLIVKSILKMDQPLNMVLRSVIEVQGQQIINTRTDSVCEILTTDKFGSHGSRPDVVLINELTHQTDKGFAETLFDNADKMPNGMVIIATNAGHDPSWQLEWKRTFAASSRWKVLEFNQPAPWVSPEAIAESERRNSRGRFLRLWWGQWTPPTGGAIDAKDVDACVTQTGPMQGNEPGWVFVGGLDIGIRKHATGFVVVGRHVGWTDEVELPRPQLSPAHEAMFDIGGWDEPEPEVELTHHQATDRLRLAHLKAWKPQPGKRVSLEAVKTEIIRAHEQFKLAAVALDPWQGEHLAELLDKAGVPVVRVFQTTAALQDQATAVIEAFQTRNLDLYHDADLLADLRALQVKDTGLKVRLISPEQTEDDGAGTGHGDLASALSFALSQARGGFCIGRHREDCKLLVYP